jgi:Icc-related predicted phosphoesterase
MRVLALADAPPPAPVSELVAAAEPELIVLVGDLEPAWIDGLAEIDLPKLGVHGNHDAPELLASVGAEDLHLRRVTHGGLSFSGLAGSPRYSRDGRYEWTDDEAAALIEQLPGANVLVTHTPPAGVNDEPDDPTHRGWATLPGWVEREHPAWLLHGHTQPPPNRVVTRIGDTCVAHVRGAAILDL